MTTPASNVQTQESIFPHLPYTIVNRFSGAVVGTGTMVFQGAPRCQVFIRPESATSPIRPDGTRAPMPWAVRWARIDPPIRTISYFGPDSSFPTIWDRYWVGACPVLGVDSSPSESYAVKIARAGGVPWAAGINVPGFPSNVRNAAITKVRLKVLDDKAQWGVTLAEMKKTIQGVRSVAEQTLDALDYLGRRVKRSRFEVARFLFHGSWPARKGRRWSPSQRMRAEKRVTGGWLEYQHSVRPTLLDIAQSGEAVSWLLFDQKRGLRFTLKAGHSEKSSVVWVTDFPNSYPTEKFGTCHTPLEVKVSCHFALNYSLEPTTTTTFQQLGLTNVAGVVWELVPYSWMVDYVLSVGDWLNSLVSIDGVYDVEGSESLKAVVKSASSPIQVQPVQDGTFFGARDATASYDVGRFERKVLSSLPAPALIPSVRNKLDLRRTAIVLAALSQLVSR